MEVGSKTWSISSLWNGSNHGRTPPSPLSFCLESGGTLSWVKCSDESPLQLSTSLQQSGPITCCHSSLPQGRQAREQGGTGEGTRFCRSSQDVGNCVWYMLQGHTLTRWDTHWSRHNPKNLTGSCNIALFLSQIPSPFFLLFSTKTFGQLQTELQPTKQAFLPITMFSSSLKSIPPLSPQD